MTANDVTRLIQHYVDKFRPLPWRSPPGSAAPDPYRVWLSEVMLQQTSVAAVIPRFARFVTRWPTLEALAAAREEDILSEWAGLGYYARARNLVACARVVAERGRFPTTAAELRQLPGIGNYTSAAIAAIAFGEPAGAVDTNVERVLSRYYAITNPGRADLERRMAAIVATGPAGDLVQAMIDLGATICLPREPRCGACPLHSGCRAIARGRPEDYPVRKARKVRPKRFGTAWWIERNGAVWLVRRPPSGVLGGMAALPGPDWADEPRQSGKPLASVRHVFTHFALELDIMVGCDPVGEGWWAPLEAIADAGLPTLYRKAVAAALERRADASPPLPRDWLEEAQVGP